MRRILLATLLLAFTSMAFAQGLDHLKSLTQQQFKHLSVDLGAALQPKQLASAEPGGISGFSIGWSLGYTDVAHENALEMAANNAALAAIPVVRLRASKGLPAGFDIGGYYAATPITDAINAWGVELRYAILDGNAAMPALGLRATYNALTGTDHLAFRTKSLGITLSKGLGPFTPYIGVGRVWMSSDPDASMGLNAVSPSKNSVFAGIGIGMGVVDMVIGYSRIGDNSTYSFKMSFGF